jgi:hypothetical protein
MQGEGSITSSYSGSASKLESMSCPFEPRTGTNSLLQEASAAEIRIRWMAFVFFITDDLK